MKNEKKEHLVKVQLGYRILMILSVLDGSYIQDEGKEIVEYLRKYLDEKELDILEEVNLFFLNTKAEEVIKMLFVYVREFADLSSNEERVELLYYAYKIVSANSVLHENHKNTLIRMGEIFGIDAHKLLEELKFEN